VITAPNSPRHAANPTTAAASRPGVVSGSVTVRSGPTDRRRASKPRRRDRDRRLRSTA
jgi:hypothetical protein